MAAFPIEAGEIFADRYRIIRCLASGGMGAVYEAVHTVTERRCALKVMLGHTAQREKLRERFMLESKLAAQIGSDYIVDILDAGVDEKTKSPYLVMELLHGEDLAQRLVRLGRFSPAETVLYLWHAALALDRTHQSSIVHRDLKASNLFLTTREDGTPLVKVLDFGVAKVMPLESGAEGHTQTVGTPIYMAPEQFRAGGRVSPATDIYALGMLAYTMLVGSHYWAEEHQNSENPFAFASVAVKGPVDPATVRAARESVTLPAGFDEWFSRATSRVPGERFACATEAVEELAEILGVSPPTASAASNAVPTPPSGALPWSIQDPHQETVDSQSAILSGALGSTGSAPLALVGPTTDGSLSDPGVTPPPERTEVSLSVTSGGLDVEEHARQKRRTRTRIVAVAVAAGAIGLGALLLPGRLENPDATAPAASKNPTVTSATPEDKAVEAPPPIPQRPERPGPDSVEPPPVPQKQSLQITSLDELPPAATETPTPSPRSPRRTVRRTPPPSPKPAPEPKAAPEPTQPAKEIARELPGPAPRTGPIDRESLYGQD